MSGCQPTEKTCIHNVTVKFDCYKCAKDHLQNQITSLSSMYKDLSIDLVRLKEHKIRQIDENRSVGRMIDEVMEVLNRLEQSREAHSRSNKQFVERLEKLERNISGDYLLVAENKKFTDAINRIEKLEEDKKIITESKPHKCPVCDGCGKIFNLSFMKHDICHACEGKSIVWG